ncbi:MAG: deoxyribodipyrimidine photo-lyase, partial [Gammaproteobacteria bacterium]
MRRLDKPRSVEELITLLPQHLSERSRPLNASKTSTTGEFVLYWMHHAVRGHENPALDAALIIADQLSVPVLVYQGLGGNHPYQNDRHHSFIMEGARDAHHELAQRGIRAVFHLPRGAKAPSPLNGLIERASLLITEDYPAPPMSATTPEDPARGR